MSRFEVREEGQDYLAESTGFVIVLARGQAEPPTSNRNMTVWGLVDGEAMASCSAANDQSAGFISSPTQTFTMPVRRGSRWHVRRASGTGPIEVRWFSRRDADGD